MAELTDARRFSLYEGARFLLSGAGFLKYGALTQMPVPQCSACEDGPVPEALCDVLPGCHGHAVLRIARQEPRLTSNGCGPAFSGDDLVSAFPGLLIRVFVDGAHVPPFGLSQHRQLD